MSIDPVTIDFAARGVQEVMRAFDSIEQRMVRLERAGASESRRGSRERIETTKRETNERERSVRKQADTQEKEAKRGAAAVAREQQKAQQAEVRAVEKKAAEVKRVEERLAQWKERVHIRSSEMAGRFAAKEVSNEIRERKRAQAEAARGSAASVRRISGIGSNVLERGRGIMGMAGATLGIGGGFLLADVARQTLDAQKQAALLVNTVTTGSAPPAGATVGNILAQAGQVSSELGVDKGQLIGASLEYSRKARGGDFAGAMANMGFFGKMSKVGHRPQRDRRRRGHPAEPESESQGSRDAADAARRLRPGQAGLDVDGRRRQADGGARRPGDELRGRPGDQPAKAAGPRPARGAAGDDRGGGDVHQGPRERGREPSEVDAQQGRHRGDGGEVRQVRSNGIARADDRGGDELHEGGTSPRSRTSSASAARRSSGPCSSRTRMPGAATPAWQLSPRRWRA